MTQKKTPSRSKKKLKRTAHKIKERLINVRRGSASKFTNNFRVPGVTFRCNKLKTKHRTRRITHVNIQNLSKFVAKINFPNYSSIF